MSTARAGVQRPLFVVTILAGSFLLFLVQPMVARMALPRLGGAPNVWNSAMLVYQALLLAGYLYAHLLGRLALQRQALVHLAVLVLAGLTLPITLPALAPPAPGNEVWWVPLLFLLSIGPVFVAVAAQAPLMQRWFAADPASGAPWALYAASNLGSFAGLIAYPLLAEPLLALKAQRLGWALGYGGLVGLVALAARARWHAEVPQSLPIPAQAELVEAPAGPHGGASILRRAQDERGLGSAQDERGLMLAQDERGGGLASHAHGMNDAITPRRVASWLALSAIPSGLMLSTTTHLTTDIFAMPLLWVIPLGLYLLSFVVAFAERRGAARVIGWTAPAIVLLAGGMAMVSRSSGTQTMVAATLALLFVVAVALHARLYEHRPGPERLTLFYLAMSAGGALGGVFTALLAPLAFDWVWEHPLLVLAAAALLPRQRWLDWRRLPGLSPEIAPVASAALAGFAAFLCWLLHAATMPAEPDASRLPLTLAIALCGLALMPWRGLFVTVLALLMLAQGGLVTLESSLQGLRTRSYFGIYTVRDYPAQRLRTLAHGTTLHGEQSTDPALRRTPLTYYGPGSGAALVLGQAPALFGQHARIGVVGLGTGTLACFHQPGQDWRIFEIDPAVVRLSQNGTFTYVRDCAPDARFVIGDARLAIAALPAAALDVLAIDAFTSDAIPLHLLTDEAFARYFAALSPHGLLLVHISNRYIDLEPVLAAEARHRGLAVALRDDYPAPGGELTASSWVVMSRDSAQLRRLAALAPHSPWTPLQPPAKSLWTDDHASVLPYIRWPTLFRSP